MYARRLLPLALLLAFSVICLGAFVRLSNAGLGCPDWPGCYGRMTVPAELALQDAGSHLRAWIEMAHRYAAGGLGLLILAIAIGAWRLPASRPLAGLLVALVILQALLGMWTVTLRLMPVVVMAHLLGGLLLLALLWIRLLQRVAPHSLPTAGAPATLARLTLAALIAQIALGGWTSANYAALACPDLPACQGSWWPEADFAEGFSLPVATEAGYEGGVHSGAGRTAIHLTHRLGAVAVTLLAGWLAVALYRRGGAARRAGLLLGAALLLQLGLGTGNVLLGLPLPVAVAHTGGAALLLMALLAAMRSLRPAPGEALRAAP